MDNYSNTTLAKCNHWLDYFWSKINHAIRVVPSHATADQMQPEYDKLSQATVNHNIRYIVEDATTDIEFQVTRHLREYDFTQ